MYRLEDAAEPAFARHETFHPRYGWFGKGVRTAARINDIFIRDEAPVELGVGKNMVRAIRFWGKASKVLIDDVNPDRLRLPLTVPSHRGMALLGDRPGLDPYLELPGSLWLLHWWMLTPQCLLPVWWLTFSVFSPVEFTSEDLCEAVHSELRHVPSWQPHLPVPGSIKKDVDCLLRMYAPQITGRFAIDDMLDCPFRELALLEPVWDDKQRFRFVLGPKPTLPPAIVAYACLDYLADVDPGARTSTVTRLVTSPGSPGRVFKLTEEALLDALHEYAAEETRVGLTAAAGLPQFTMTVDPHELAVAALRSYYRQAGHPADGPLLLDLDPAETNAQLWPRAEAGARS